jgi:cytochrome bd-type quinol oxidase subunit 2
MSEEEYRFTILGTDTVSNAPLYEGTPFSAFITLQLTAIVAAIMTAFGGRDLYTSKNNEARDVRLMRAGIIIFILVFSVAVVLAVVTMTKVKGYKAERNATICALLAVPFMSVRLAYSAGSLFSGSDSVLNPISSDDTSVWLHLFMVIIMEYAVTLSATAVALTAKRVGPMETEIDEMSSNEIEKKKSETSGEPSPVVLE